MASDGGNAVTTSPALITSHGGKHNDSLLSQPTLGLFILFTDHIYDNKSMLPQGHLAAKSHTMLFGVFCDILPDISLVFSAGGQDYGQHNQSAN